MSITAIILAAGEGTRMKSSIPKVMHKVAFAPMIEHAIQSCAFAEESVVVISQTLKGHPDFQGTIDKHNIATVTQERQFGTGDAVQIAFDKHNITSESILIMMGDTPLIKRETLEKAYNYFIASGVAIQILAFEAKEAKGYGRILHNTSKQVKEIIEEKDANNDTKNINLCNSGIMFITANIAKSLLPKISNNNAQGERYLTDIVRLANDCDNKVTYFKIDAEEALGINNRVQLSQAETIMQQRLRIKHMESGVTLIDPSTVYFAIDSKLGQDITIFPNVYIGSETNIEDNVTIYANSVLSHCKIASGCFIGPFARIRPGSNLDKDCKIGNFVEVKNAKLATGVKASHLTYLGDIDIGESSNIGAGTIVCNYDGVEKHHSTIGKRGFIGSNTAIISPINIGDDALVGAGSVITKDVDSQALAIARAEQKNLPYKIKKKK